LPAAIVLCLWPDLSVCLTSFAIIFVGARNEGPADAAALTTDARARIAQSFGKLPLSFEINKGQVEQPVKFVSRGPGYVLFLTPAEAVLTLEKPRKESDVREGAVLRLKMIGANAAPARPVVSSKARMAVERGPQRITV
jgi:hypothetical protein